MRETRGAETEVRIELDNGATVRKDGLIPQKNPAENDKGTAIIIKPNTPSGHRMGEKREKLMQDNGYKTESIYYNPKDPAYKPGSPTYIGPQNK